MVTSTADAPRRRVAILVFNAFTNDSRVLNVAGSLADVGDDVVVLGVQVGEVPSDETTSDGVRVVRLPFDPLYYRLWERRAAFLRPWRHWRELGAMLQGRIGRGGLVGAIGAVLATVLLGIPWLLLSAGYHAAARLGWAARRAVGRKPRGRRGSWLEERYKRLLFLAPHAVRVLTWSRAVRRAYASGSLPPPHLWHANDLETLPVALLLRQRHGGRVVYDSHEIWMEMPGPSGMGRLRRRLLAWSEGWMARSADARITINDALADELERRWSSQRPIAIRSLPRRWEPPDGFVSPLREALDARGIARERRVVLYHGNLDRGRGIEPLLSAAEAMGEVALAFLGGGSLGASLDAASATEPWSGRLVVLPPVAPDDVIAWVAGADVSACLIEPTTLNHRLSSPNKLYQAIAAGVPVLASDSGPIREDVERYRVGVWCDPTDPHAIAAALGLLLKVPADQYQALRANARQAHLEELNWEREATRLFEIYDTLAPHPVATAVPVSAPD